MFGGAERSMNKIQKTGTNASSPEIRDDLVVELDYKTVKKEVWSKFIKIYAGGPSICRDKPYIYSSVVEDTLTPISQSKSPSETTLRYTSTTKRTPIAKKLTTMASLTKKQELKKTLLSKSERPQ